MRLTKQTNYALRLMMYCALNDKALSRVPDIARAYAISEPFMFKILQGLVAAGLVDTVRGRSGGIRLSRPAKDITVLDVVRTTEESFSMAECFDDDEADCPLIDSCALNATLREALNAFFEVLARYTIADLVASKVEIAQRLGLETATMLETADA
ncbi:MAG: iron-responsive transcriptional regulator RirA [Pseudomonadota bacterium]